MNQPEYTALQVTVLVRTEPGRGEQIKAFFDGVSFQYQLQDTLATEVKAQLEQHEIEFDEVIISLDAPAQEAKKSRSKSSLMGRLFGKG